MQEPKLIDIRAAHQRIAPFAQRTPVLTSRIISRMAKANVFFKGENFQKVGACKFRGAMKTLLSLSETEKSRGVVTHSSGNHAQALSLAAKLLNVPAYIVMPTN